MYFYDFSCNMYCLYKKKQIGHLKKGLNPISITHLAFGGENMSTALKTGIVTGVIALAVIIYSHIHAINHRIKLRNNGIVSS